MLFRWLCVALPFNFILANTMYSPKRWYTPEWSGLFAAVICSYFTFGFCASTVAFGWMESMNLQQFCAVEKTSLYQHHNIANFDDHFAVRLHTDATHTVQIDIPYVDLKKNFSKIAYPLNTYMTSLRIFFSEYEDFECIWSDLESSEQPSAFISTSLEKEREVLRITQGRVSGSTELSNGRNKQFARTLQVSLKVAETIVEDVETLYLPSISDDYVNFEDFVEIYEDRIQAESVKELDDSGFSPKYAKDVVTAVKLYIRDSLVPFINRHLKRRNSIAEAAASFILEREWYSDVFMLISERHYNNVSWTFKVENEAQTVTVTQATRILFSVKDDYNTTKLLDNYAGYGAFSIIKMECLHLSEVIPRLQEQFNVTHTHCVTGKTNLNIYNTLVGSPILSMFATPLTVDTTKDQRQNDFPLRSRMDRVQTPETEGGASSVEEVVKQSIAYERSLAYHDPKFADAPRFRVMSLGLGGGEMHMYLLNHFPTAEVTSVDISEEIFRTSQEFLGLRFGVCRASRLTSAATLADGGSDDNATASAGVGVLEDISDIADAAYASTIHATSDQSNTCRSQVVISDAWDYILHQAAVRDAAEATSQPFDHLYYDLFIFDVYDFAASRWNGNSDTSSSPEVDRASSDASLRTIQSLLRPGVGLTAFHLHADNQFQGYYDQIVRIFGADQVVLLVVTSNDYMVVAAREKYRTPSHLLQTCSGDDSTVRADPDVCTLPVSRGNEVHPCEQPLDFVQHAVEMNQLYGLSFRISRASLYSLSCKDKTDYLVQV